MFLNWSFPTFRSTTFIYFHISLQRDDHSCWKFGCDPLRASDLVLSIFNGFWVICCSDFVSRNDHRFRWSEGRSVKLSKIMDHDPICWMLWHHDGFFQTTAGFRSDQGQFIIELLMFFRYHRQTLFTSLPLHYFDLKSDWLPLFTVAFGSPPEDLLMLYLLFVPIR